MFEFGKNWASFSRQLDDTRIAEAVASLNSLFGEGALKGRSFLDIGCGSGLFSVAAARLGAFPVVGIDVDPVSVQVSCENAQRWLEGAIQPTFRHASALDDAAMQSLGTFDIVYSWGVLHHTGDMKHALAGAARAVKPGGSLMIAIYNRHWSSGMWKVIKWAYNHAGRFGQKLLIWLMTPVIFAAKWMVTRRNPLSMRRGMDFMHNIVDWVGGYPYEYASAAEMEAMLEELGLRVENVRRAVVPTACNEFVCRRAS